MRGYLVLLGGPNVMRTGRDATSAAFTKIPKIIFFSEDEALAHAETLAKQNLEVPVMIFHTEQIVETSTPKFMHKKFNKEGELIPTDNVV